VLTGPLFNYSASPYNAYQEDMSMEMNDMILVSVDDHIIEPADMFERHIPEKYRDRAPRVIQDANGDMWEFEGNIIPTVGLNAVVGRPPEEFGMEPTAFAQMRKGTYDIHARIDDMNANGVLGSIGYPTFIAFAGAIFLKAKDKELARVVISAYNDWHVDEWCATAPGRFIPIGILPLWDIEASVVEVKRLAAKGVHTVSLMDNPAVQGLPSIHDRCWEPLWKVLEDNQMVISSHIGSGWQPPHASMASPIDAWIVTMPMSIANAAADWLFSPIFRKFPKLKIALAEGGIGWIPYFLERADFTYHQHKAWTHSPYNLGTKLPSEVFRDNFLTCFIDDAFGLQNSRYLNMDAVMWECDYPHSDCVWPRSPEVLWESVKHLAPATIDNITHQNVMREFSYNPFSVLKREECTVGALRAKAKDVDVGLVSGLGGGNPSSGDGLPVTSGQVIGVIEQSMRKN
jgi:predicted TIM-barrel fold metal-dependent hydrolase